MNQNDILDALSEYKNQFAEKYGILAIGIFGSTARNEDRKDSDVDFIINYDIKYRMGWGLDDGEKDN